MGSVRPGVPTLTIGLRGMAQPTMEVETLAGPKHSGQYGGAAPTRSACSCRRSRRSTTRTATSPSGPEAPAVDRGRLHGGRVPHARRGERRAAAGRFGRSRLTHLVGACDHGDRHRHQLRRRRAQRGQCACPGEDQHARAPGPGRRRGSGGRRPSPGVRAPVRHRADRQPRGDGQRLPRRHLRSRV